ncbi:MAG: WYL domain-containing protein [Actinomycetes bacterium]
MSRTTASDRVERILSILPWIIQNPGTPVVELSRRFGLSEEDLRKDLDLVFYEVGLYPFTPDVLVEVLIEDDCVTVNLADYFHRPARLTHEAALILLTAGRAFAGRDGSDPDDALNSAVRKLSAALGEGPEAAVEVALGPANPQILNELQAALAQHRRVSLGYFSYSRDDTTTREVDPYRILSRDGHWYLLAFCHLAQDQRLFRIDRIQSVTSTELSFELPEFIAEVQSTLTGVSRTVELVGPVSISWVADAYPYDEFEQLESGDLRLVIPVTATAWLERLLLRLDPATRATDLESGEPLEMVRSAAAQRILQRYRATAAR